VQIYFGDLAGESATSRTSSMKKGNFGTNRSDLDKNNIIKPTFDTLTEEDRKVFEAYRTEVDELLYLHYEVTW
jgi:Holliday junction resolvase RusA-like endonuclease